eukprot:Hpha_TRINITY_DN11786_c0_g1::TRINITY_DN11786_c0_g1_i1::g.31713::m.31713
MEESIPRVLRVDAPPKPRLSGLYAMIEGMEVNGHPVWGCDTHRLYATSFGNWGIGYQEDSPMKNTAWIVSRGRISSSAPHLMAAWKYNDGEMWSPSSQIQITRVSDIPLVGDSPRPAPTPPAASSLQQHSLIAAAPSPVPAPPGGMRTGEQDEAPAEAAAVDALEGFETVQSASPSPSPARDGPVPPTGGRVQRNPLCWTHDNQDGGPGSQGTVLSADTSNVTVRWDAGGVFTYRWGGAGSAEVVLVANAADSVARICPEEFATLRDQCRDLSTQHKRLESEHEALQQAHERLLEQCKGLHTAAETAEFRQSQLAEQYRALEERPAVNPVGPDHPLHRLLDEVRTECVALKAARDEDARVRAQLARQLQESQAERSLLTQRVGALEARLVVAPQEYSVAPLSVHAPPPNQSPERLRSAPVPQTTTAPRGVGWPSASSSPSVLPPPVRVSVASSPVKTSLMSQYFSPSAPAAIGLAGIRNPMSAPSGGASPLPTTAPSPQAVQPHSHYSVPISSAPPAAAPSAVVDSVYAPAPARRTSGPPVPSPPHAVSPGGYRHTSSAMQ